ncbi:MAG: hypothetical protein PHN56_07250 [Candidatus Nanoarchaeia archaeon]|nr:hypothetical protein [Candidatus Nanoarchaeia archaeon]
MKVSVRRIITFLIILSVCVFAAFLINGNNSIEKYDQIISALFFVYGILSAYYLTKVQEVESGLGLQSIIEASSWKMIYLIIKKECKKEYENLSEKIYNYIKIVYSTVYREYHRSDNEYYKILDYLFSLKNVKLFDYLMDYIKALQDSREEQKILFKKSRNTRVYMLLYVLLILCISSIYILKGNDFLYNIIVGSFSAAMILMMQIIFEKKNLAGDEYNVFFRPFDEIIDLMGKKRIYSESAIKEGIIDTKLLDKKKIPYDVIKGK